MKIGYHVDMLKENENKMVELRSSWKGKQI